MRLRGSAGFSEVFGIARWRSATSSTLQAGRKEAAARGFADRSAATAVRPSSCPFPPTLWNNLYRLPTCFAVRVRRELDSPPHWRPAADQSAVPTFDVSAFLPA